MKYKAVIFDLYGTLIGNMADYNNWLKEMASVVSTPEGDFVRLRNAAFSKRMMGEFTRFQDCLVHICQQLALPVAKEQIECAVRLRFDRTRQEMMTPQPYAIETISRLKVKGL